MDPIKVLNLKDSYLDLAQEQFPPISSDQYRTNKIHSAEK